MLQHSSLSLHQEACRHRMMNESGSHGSEYVYITLVSQLRAAVTGSSFSVPALCSRAAQALEQVISESRGVRVLLFWELLGSPSQAGSEFINQMKHTS